MASSVMFGYNLKNVSAGHNVHQEPQSARQFLELHVVIVVPPLWPL